MPAARCLASTTTSPAARPISARTNSAARFRTTVRGSVTRLRDFVSSWLNIGRMEVRLFPNSARPGVGLKPRREAQRPLLPQHARHCPVLEAGSAMGFLVFPPLETYESYYVGYEG